MRVENAEAKQRFDVACNAIQSRLDVRLAAYEQILRCGAAFFAHKSGVTRQDWHEFAMCQKISEYFPGIQNIGFTQLVPRSRLAQHIAEIRAEGFPEYRVWPEGDREMYSPVVFIEPFAGRNLRVFGYDNFSEPERRATLELSRDEDRAALSGKLTLVQETGQDVQAGALMFAPVYRSGMPHETVAERRAALIGWVYSAYRINDLMKGIFGDRNLADGEKIQLKIFDGKTPGNLLYESLGSVGRHPAQAAGLTRETVINAAGRDWLLVYTDLQETSRRAHIRIWSIILGGTLISFLLAGLVFSWANTYFNAVKMAKELTAGLEQRVQERTALLETANQELEAFSYSISHDLRAPLRAIQGFAHILQEDFAPSLDSEMVRLLNIISSEARRMGQLIDALLHFSQLNRLPLKQEIVSSKELVNQALAQLQAAQAGRTIKISVGELPETVGDRALLLQVWVNLLSNALKYTSPRSVPEIWIGARQEGGEVIYFVKDNGVGFDMKYADKLFGVFQRLHTSDEFEGNGVGLSLIQRIIHRHGGRVWAESVVTQGATFFFTLPASNPANRSSLL